MTDTPNLSAIAMRTRAAEACRRSAGECREYSLPQAAVVVAAIGGEILALPLEADPAALVAEALRLPEIAALVEAATEQAEYLSLCGEDGDLLRNLLRALQPFAALVQP